MELKLTNEERMELQIAKLETEKAAIIFTQKKNTYMGLIKKICEKNNKSLDKITAIDLTAGQIKFKDNKQVKLKKK